jgi:hypothetical protein
MHNSRKAFILIIGSGPTRDCAPRRSSGPSPQAQGLRRAEEDALGEAAATMLRSRRRAVTASADTPATSKKTTPADGSSAIGAPGPRRGRSGRSSRCALGGGTTGCPRGEGRANLPLKSDELRSRTFPKEKARTARASQASWSGRLPPGDVQLRTVNRSGLIRERPRSRSSGAASWLHPPWRH